MARPRTPSPMRLLALVSAAACGALEAAPASAQCPGGAVVTLTDSAGNAWDLDANGAVVNGSANAFDGLYTLTIAGTAFMAAGPPAMELSGRQIAYPSTLVVSAGVMVSRRVYVPTDAAWARWIDEYANIGATPRTVAIELRLNSGADMDLEVIATSDGDTMLETGDSSFVLDNALTPPPEPPMETAPPASCHVLWGAGGAVTPSSLSSGASFSCMGTEGATVRYSLTIPSLSRVRVMYFAAQSSTRAGATSACASLATLPDATFADLSGAERMVVVNWPIIDRPLGSPCGSDSACSSGECVDGVCCESACGGGALDDCEACSDAAGSTAPDGTCGVSRSTYDCRAEASACDLPERCDGTARTCPADVVRAAGVLCRPAPPGSCDVAESCDGTRGTCPPDRFVADGTTCDDAVACTQAWCLLGTCVPIGTACDDGNACTTDSCPGGTLCSNVPVAGCDGGPPVFPDAGPFDGGGAEDDAGGGGDMDGGGEEIDGAVDLDGSAGRMDARARRDGDPLTTADLALGGGGCSCRIGAGRAADAWGLAALVAVVLRIVRRRRGRGRR